MVASGACLRNSDGHAIFDSASRVRINKPADIVIADHVWLGISTLVLKGATIGSGAIVGAYAVVTSTLPALCIAVGTPARVLRKGVQWTRARTDTAADFFEARNSKDDRGTTPARHSA